MRSVVVMDGCVDVNEDYFLDTLSFVIFTQFFCVFVWIAPNVETRSGV
jgi:hypothetical protein